MNITFITIANEAVASYRYHIQIPARELLFLGHQVNISPVPDIELPNSDVYIFSKHFNHRDYWYARDLKKQGKKTIFHCCDNHFQTQHEEHYRRMLREVDRVIVPTNNMAKIVKRETGRESVIIDDPYEYPMDIAHYSGLLPLKVLWYGHRRNLQGLEPLLPLPDFCELRICTKWGNTPIPMIFDKVPYLPWSYDNMLKSFKWADVVIIPLDAHNEQNIGRSANRLVEAVRRGCFVIASPIDSYKEFDEYMYVGDIVTGLQWLQTQDISEINKRIVEAQKLTESKYSPKLIGQKWEEACQL